MSNEKRSTHAGSGQGRPASWPADMAFYAWRSRFAQALLIAIVLAAVFVLARITAGPKDSGEATAGQATAAATSWTCSMHPQIKLPKFGQCPICFMDLIPVGAGDDGASGTARMPLSERARVLARVETTEVRHREIEHEIQLVGKVAIDETQLTYISSYIPGRIDRLFVDYTGILVRKGDHLAEIYSPELLVAQREFLLALDSVERSTSMGGAALANAQSVLDAAKRKLELWGIPKDEIERLSRDRRPSDHMRLDAPMEGWVVERQGYQGMYVETGTRLFTVVDLHRLWVMLDAYELDVQFLRPGQPVRFETESYPGRTFDGRISYIDPLLNESTRTVKVRVNLENPNLELRPGMFVRGHVHVKLGADGRVVGNELAGKWICPMHPEIVKEGPAQCDKCGMDLVTADSLGFAAVAAGGGALAVPGTAVLLTGRRAVVYAETQDEQGPVYECRVVELGPRAGDWYVIQSGLREGERVVTRGAIQIDSAMQIQAHPSMMQPPAEPPVSKAGADDALRSIVMRAVKGAAYHTRSGPVLAAYMEFTAALAADDIEKARAAADRLKQRAADAAPDGLSGDDAAHWTQLMRRIADAVPDTRDAAIDALRLRLPEITRAVETYLRTFGHAGDTKVYRTWCPMALDNKGAGWLQADPGIRNAYFGSKMLRCGEIKGVIGADGKESAHE